MTETSRDSSFALSDTYVDQVDIGLNPGDPLSSSPKNADEHLILTKISVFSPPKSLGWPNHAKNVENIAFG